MNNQLENVLEKIADSIAENYIFSLGNSLGLFTGGTGVITFLAYYNQFNGKDKYKLALEKLLEKCCEQICTTVCSPSYCNGITGILQAFEHLKEKAFIDIDFSDIYQGYHYYLIRQMLQYSLVGNNDLLHGATGIAMYLLKKQNTSQVNQFIDILERSGQQEDCCIKWKSLFNVKDNLHFYNISLSHGMSHIVLFLNQCIRQQLELDKVLNLLEKVINYILKQEMDHRKYGSYFPTISLEVELSEKRKSRLAWCYGDLGVALALWYAGNTVQNDIWKKKALEVFDFAATRRDLSDNMVSDAGLCHGTAGIAQIFRRLFWNTGKELYLATSEYWIAETLKMSKWEDGLAGYKVWLGDVDNWANRYDFLNGISGIGLVLLAAIAPKNYSDWDRFLLLSNFS